MSLAAFSHASIPPRIFNVSGAEKLRIREVCRSVRENHERDAQIAGVEAPDALLNDASASYPLLGAPHVDSDQMIQWIADWVMRGGESLDKPTHFEARDGRF